MLKWYNRWNYGRFGVLVSACVAREKCHDHSGWCLTKEKRCYVYIVTASMAEEKSVFTGMTWR